MKLHHSYYLFRLSYRYSYGNRSERHDEDTSIIVASTTEDICATDLLNKRISLIPDVQRITRDYFVHWGAVPR